LVLVGSFVPFVSFASLVFFVCLVCVSTGAGAAMQGTPVAPGCPLLVFRFSGVVLGRCAQARCRPCRVDRRCSQGGQNRPFACAEPGDAMCDSSECASAQKPQQPFDGDGQPVRPVVELVVELIQGLVDHQQLQQCP
jgi:hypothetical protein